MGTARGAGASTAADAAGAGTASASAGADTAGGKLSGGHGHNRWWFVPEIVVRLRQRLPSDVNRDFVPSTTAARNGAV